MGKVADLYDRSGLNSASPLTSRKAQNSLREEAWEVFKVCLSLFTKKLNIQEIGCEESRKNTDNRSTTTLKNYEKGF